MFISPTDHFPFIPKRIISLVPSQTELLYTLGLEEEVVGITKFCLHPDDWFRSKERIGGTKKLNIEKIISLQPDLLIANKEENVKEQVELLSKYFPVFVTKVDDYPSALKMIDDIGTLVGKTSEATSLVKNIDADFQSIVQAVPPVKAVYLIWKEPYMTVGGDTFINDMMLKAGFLNIFQNRNRYPQVTVAELREKEPEVVLLSSEPYPFKPKHIDELQQHLPGTKILLADGEIFSWYGSRMLHAPAYFKKLNAAFRGIPL